MDKILLFIAFFGFLAWWISEKIRRDAGVDDESSYNIFDYSDSKCVVCVKTASIRLGNPPSISDHDKWLKAFQTYETYSVVEVRRGELSDVTCYFGGTVFWFSSDMKEFALVLRVRNRLLDFVVDDQTIDSDVLLIGGTNTKNRIVTFGEKLNVMISIDGKRMLAEYIRYEETDQLLGFLQNMSGEGQQSW